MFCPEIACPDVMDFVTETSACAVMTLWRTMLSTRTPHDGAAGLTSVLVSPLSWVNSHQSRIERPAMPLSFMWTCFSPAESPAHADKSWR